MATIAIASHALQLPAMKLRNNWSCPPALIQALIRPSYCCRVETVPQVCRTWREASAVPSRMWEGLCINVGCACAGEAEHAQRPHSRGGVDCERLAAWLAPRSASVHTLMISTFQEEPPLHRYASWNRQFQARSRCMHASVLMRRVSCTNNLHLHRATLSQLQFKLPPWYRRLLEAVLPNLAALQELRVFSAGVMEAPDLELLAQLLHSPPDVMPGCALRELSLSFAPAEGFAAADLDAIGRCAAVPLISAPCACNVQPVVSPSAVSISILCCSVRERCVVVSAMQQYVHV